MMCIKKNKPKQKISVADLLQLIPDDKICSLAKETNVDYCSKVLYGRSVFYLLLYGLLQSERSSQRTLEDVFNSDSFKLLFNINPDKSIRHSSISERLSGMNVTFFVKIFELFYEKLSSLYSEKEMLGGKIARVDSTMVSDACSKLSQGMCVGRKKDGKKQIKYTIGFDGLFPTGVSLFSSREALCEDLTVPKAVFSQAKKQKGKVFVFDRGVSKRTAFSYTKMVAGNFYLNISG
jgi:hypothetical protein